MEEKRRSKRLDLEVTIQLEHLSQGDITTVKLLKVDVADVSSTGMGFVSTIPMEIGSVYDTKIQIWTKEVISAVLRIVRCEKIDEEKYSCGATFVGLSESDQLKINIYQMLNPEE